MFSYLEESATARLEQKIDAGIFSDEQLIEIKIPLNMPYYSDKEYESVYGETNLNGEHYRYVKRKVSNNILYLLCIPNKEKNSITEAKNDFTKSASDIATNNPTQQKHSNSVVKFILSEYLPTDNAITYNKYISDSCKLISPNSEATDLFYPSTPAQPPETAVFS